MRKILFASLLVLTAAATASQAQPVPSYEVTIQPCRAYDSRIDTAFSNAPFGAGETRYFKVRGITCNVPTDANALHANVVAHTSIANGYIRVWQSDVPAPLATSLSFRGLSGADSSLIKTLLSYPALEDPNDFAVQANCPGLALNSPCTHIVIDVSGWTIPVPIVE